MNKIYAIVVLALVSFGVSGCKTHHEMHSTSTGTHGGSYPLTKCVVSGEDLGDKPYTFVYHGQTVKLCCEDCQAKFNAEPAKYIAKINQAK